MGSRWSGLEEFDRLPSSEKVLLLQDLWDRIAESPEELEVTDAQRAELDRRLAAHDADPSTAIPWAQVRARLSRSEGVNPA